MNDGALLDLLLVSCDDQLGLFDLGFESLDFRQRFGKNLSSAFVAGFQLFEQCLVFDNELSMPLDFAIFDRHDPAPLNDRPSRGLEKENPAHGKPGFRVLQRRSAAVGTTMLLLRHFIRGRFLRRKNRLWVT